MAPALAVALAALAALAAVGLHGRAGNGVHVVVSRYAEDVSWLHVLPKTRVTVYDKGGPSNADADCPSHATRVVLPNVGREVHTYLHHIVEHYHDLEDVTIFLPASINKSPEKWDKAMRVVDHAMRTRESMFPVFPAGQVPIRVSLAAFTLESWRSTHPGNARANPESTLLPSPDRPFGKWYAKHGLPDVNTWCSEGIFAVSRDHIHRRSRAQYRALMEGLDGHSNPEAAHFMERAWVAVFAPRA